MASVVGMSSGAHGLVPGTLGRDGAGRFLAHPQGYLRLRYRWAPRAWLFALRRRGVPAAGLIAAETAASPLLEELLRAYRAEGGRAA